MATSAANDRLNQQAIRVDLPAIHFFLQPSAVTIAPHAMPPDGGSLDYGSHSAISNDSFKQAIHGKRLSARHGSWRAEA